MWIALFNWFVKITGWPAAKLVFRTQLICEEGAAKRGSSTGPVIIISNHTSVYDYALYLFVFFSRTLRVPMAELLFDRKPLKIFLTLLGGVRVNRSEHDFGFIAKLEKVLSKGGAVLAFPESRIPGPDEPRPLEFKTSMAYLALRSGAPIIPVYTNGRYFTGERARVVIGKPMYAAQLCSDLTDKTKAIAEVNTAMRNKIIELSKLLNGDNV